MNITQIDSNVLELSIIPCDDTLERVSEQNLNVTEMFALTWNVSSFVLDKLELQVSFENPIAVS